MYFSKSLFIFAMLGAAQAKPTPLTLEHDDVLTFDENGLPIVQKQWEYQIEQAKADVRRRKAGDSVVARAPAEARDEKRGCEESTEVQILEETDFTNWDVAMSPVLGNTGSTIATVSVASGYSIANAIAVSISAKKSPKKAPEAENAAHNQSPAQVSVGVSLGPLESILTYSLGITSTTTWTTTETLTYSFNVPPGQYGIIISNPYTHRVAGNLLSGCTDSPTVDAFTSDSYTSMQSGSLSWVRGPITMCNSSTYPIPYCIGTGEHA